MIHSYSQIVNRRSPGFSGFRVKISSATLCAAYFLDGCTLKKCFSHSTKIKPDPFRAQKKRRHLLFLFYLRRNEFPSTEKGQIREQKRSLLVSSIFSRFLQKRPSISGRWFIPERCKQEKHLLRRCNHFPRKEILSLISFHES